MPQRVCLETPISLHSRHRLVFPLDPLLCHDWTGRGPHVEQGLEVREPHVHTRRHLRADRRSHPWVQRVPTTGRLPGVGLVEDEHAHQPVAARVCGHPQLPGPGGAELTPAPLRRLHLPPHHARLHGVQAHIFQDGAGLPGPHQLLRLRILGPLHQHLRHLPGPLQVLRAPQRKEVRRRGAADLVRLGRLEAGLVGLRRRLDLLLPHHARPHHLGAGRHPGPYP
mmetsp:Transcript_2781/g.9380  ORF Transcript_2781/g.9380 Transcript_2781/m.9380 type:complete len:224 (-) Transcript_2781:897-1568(-)